MAYSGKNPTYNWLNLEPQNADPSNPEEGDIYYSDGTPRTEGPWVYVNGSWAQFSTGAAITSVNNLTLLPQSSDPGSPAEGMMFYSDGTSRTEGIWVYSNSTWVQVTGVKYLEYTQKNAVTVRVASTANVNLASQVENGDTIDGVVLATGNLVLLKNQTTSTENGVYVVQVSGAPVRDTSADTASEISFYVAYVSSGTTNTGKIFIQNNSISNLATDAQSWSETPSSRSITAYSNELTIEACSGGGGGGSGARSAGGGGAGGSGATPHIIKILTTPGDTVNFTLGLGGKGGLTSAGAGNPGGNGGVTSVTYNGKTYNFPAGKGGLGGVSSAGVAATTEYASSTISGVLSAGAGGAGGAPGAAGGNAYTNIYTSTAASGGIAFGGGYGGSGGGGGSAYGAGGPGGVGANSGTPNKPAAATNPGSGGGGGGGNNGGGSSGGEGGLGAGGYIRFSW